MKKAFLTAILILAVAVVGWCVCRCVAPCPRVSADRPAAELAHQAGSRECVVGMGRIEPAGGVIDVGAMLGDRLGSLLVKEDQNVKKGQPLADLESRDLRSLQLDAAKLNVKKAEAAGLGVAAYEQKIELLKVALALAKKDQERLKGLSKELVTEQERERQTLVVQQAASELESAQATLRQMRRANDLGQEAAKLDLKSAEAQYARSQIIAPCDGTILKTYIRPGETISAKPILQMADLSQMVVVVEVYENEIKYIRPGQPAQVTSRAFLAPYDQKGLQGKVTRVGRMISTPVLKSVDPFAPADRHVVEVRVQLDAEGSRQSAAFSNLQVDVRFPKGD